MHVKMRRVLAVGLFWALSVSWAGEKNKSLGSWLREQTDRADEAVQKSLELNPDVQHRINQGINNFTDNLIDFATPESDDETRQMQRNAVQMMLNPNHKEASRNLDELIRGAAGIPVEGASGTPGPSSPSRVSDASDSSRPRPIAAPATLAAPNSHGIAPAPGSAFGRGSAGLPQRDSTALVAHQRFWSYGDQLVLASSSFFTDLHHSVTAFITESLGLAPNEAALVASLIMAIVGIQLLVVLWKVPRMKLKRRLRRAEQELQTLRGKANA